MILSNRDLALMKVIKDVFSRTINLLYQFHVNKNIGPKCRQYVVNDTQKVIDTLWMKVVWTSDKVEYNQYL